ncbi:hypothetical protein BG53_05840 [Paenibacillus darwinianus]|uniref:Uncharacterized protein n=1 Tax=Paenibacillus darwinianus TaxID=1380763 RepID=A0A9W5S000_9BACL|nr:hypothetical protein [Paenibacillus darwinianus]EXX85622.1 hypothetical protein CH50_09140 [Paenibacillus darwinianus]EXX85841.1 hypothetical protein BG52_07585 [Paenibacillus darwinianus]EXX86567.1 hypothetical protein BG53_05840 [Paenibacillus darwinianus]
MFETEVEMFVQEQRRSAKGQRLEQLNRDLIAERKMLGTILRPVFGSFDGMIMEYELVSMSGVRIYIDVFYQPLSLGFESEGFVVHAENITRDRFNFEKMRQRTLALYDCKYVPFSWDELDKKPELCRRAVYELLGRYGAAAGSTSEPLPVYERELLRYALRLNRPFKFGDVSMCLQAGERVSRRVLRSLLEKDMIRPNGTSIQRHHSYILTDKARHFYMDTNSHSHGGTPKERR